MDLAQQISPDTERLLKQLTVQQHLHPRCSVRTILTRISEHERIDGRVIDHAIAQARVDAHRAIGRLTRREITHLASTLQAHRNAPLHLVDAA